MIWFSFTLLAEVEPWWDSGVIKHGGPYTCVHTEMDFKKLWDCDEGRMSSALWGGTSFLTDQLKGHRIVRPHHLNYIQAGHVVTLSLFNGAKTWYWSLVITVVTAKRFHNSSIMGHHYEKKNSKRRKKWEERYKKKWPTDYRNPTDLTDYQSAVHSALQRGAAISVSLSSLKRKRFSSTFFARETLKSCINLWNGLIDKVKYESRKEKSSCTMLLKDQRVKTATVF